ncbi:hypothetical protein AXF42_Ash013350 [Apostasia shenzhenica]|uniref:Uncharacterized protein n=1 Tax=Apostasia shenzhenica TaxID=1088818 RepID=A0A2I0BBU1_9ASPA|nr:hypothetical protein AXF42_Ash013350 [Apostasia shenzhenica]
MGPKISAWWAGPSLSCMDFLYGHSWASCWVRSHSGPVHGLHFLGRLLGPKEYFMVGWAFLKLHGLSEWAALGCMAFLNGPHFQISSFIRPG